jgi:hypothetical protein
MIPASILANPRVCHTYFSSIDCDLNRDRRGIVMFDSRQYHPHTQGVPVPMSARAEISEEMTANRGN